MSDPPGEAIYVPLFARVWVFPFERLWQRRGSIAARHVALVDTPDLGQVLDETWPHGFRQDGDAVLLALGAAKDDLATFEVDVLDAQLDTLHKAQAFTRSRSFGAE